MEQKKDLDERLLKSICWDCQNAYAHKCCWFRDYTPVEGWVAKKKKHLIDRKNHTSYCVLECPNFVKDIVPEKVKTRKIYKKHQMLKIMDKV